MTSSSYRANRIAAWPFNPTGNDNEFWISFIVDLSVNEM